MTLPNATTMDSHLAAPQIEIRRIGFDDLREAIARGFADFGASRTDVLFLCVIYPVLGLVLGRAASGQGFMTLLFPLASGFALVGPLAAVGLNEMSRRRERGEVVRWSDAFGVLKSPAIGAIAMLGFLLGCLLVAWLVVAQLLFNATLGPQPPASASDFAHDLLFTAPGNTLIVLGTGVGFGFAVLALSISVVSFPLLLDRNVSINTAVATSMRAVAANPVILAGWGAIVTGGLVLGSLPAFLGLIVVMPVLGHATWHLYRRLVV